MFSFPGEHILNFHIPLMYEAKVRTQIVTAGMAHFSCSGFWDMTSSFMGKPVVKNVNAQLKFLYRKGAFFGITERRM